jgi:Leucine-rich repeat (LRR) protein
MEAEPPKADPPKRKRRWFQFRLRTLLVGTLIVGLASGRLGKTIEEKYNKQREVEEQRKSWDEAHTIAATIKRQLGVSAMACSQLSSPAYVWVSVDPQQATDATLERLGTVPQIGSLTVSGGQITDTSLRHLSNLTGLQRLVLHTKHVTDAGLPHLMGMTKLRKLDLKSPKVTDAGVNELQKALPNCEIDR